MPLPIRKEYANTSFASGSVANSFNFFSVVCLHLVPEGTFSSMTHEVPTKEGGSFTSLMITIITEEDAMFLKARPAEQSLTHLSVAVMTRRYEERRSKSSTTFAAI